MLTFLSAAFAKAQAVYVDGLPRDTSYNLNRTFLKERKKFPFIRPVYSKLPKGVVAYEGLVYSVVDSSPYEDRKLHVNLYRLDNNKVYPALIMVHGGGWSSGDFTMQIPLAQQIAARGYVTVPVEYRLTPEAKYPAGIHDLRACVRWVRTHAEQYGIDASRIAISGCSAGGQMATLVGAANGVPQYESQRGNTDISGMVQAVVNVDGLSDFTVKEAIERAARAKAEEKNLPVDAQWLGGAYEERSNTWKEASPVYWVSHQSAPVCFINSSTPRFHNGRDKMIQKLDSLSIYSEVHTMEDTPHPFWLFEPWFDPTVSCIVNFLDRVLSK
ncbi:MAG: alpha/beta hydrolase [Prevotellaceae bacterium]|jgi:pectinesterase|nr:alpha/beta hydrolase [Prevotellaceae bacterium]